MKKVLALSLLLSSIISAQAATNVQTGQVWVTGAAFNPSVAAPAFGTFLRPFAANSPWNSKPVNPVLGTKVVVMPSEASPIHLPQISSDKWSTAVFPTTKEDPPMTVYTNTWQSGISNLDAGTKPASIVIPHWPTGVTPATGNDGHADIVDVDSGKIYSFWQLQNVDGQWRASKYSWSPLNGTGFGDPAHSNQGPRAASVPTIAGLIRANEIKDGEPVYKHALAMSLDDASLSPTAPSYVYPATSTDADIKTNHGTLSDGARLMLPADFQLSANATADLRKVVETLKQYGAYIVDKNMDTPYYIYVEIGSELDLGELNPLKADLEKIRLALRPLVSAEKWVDGNGVDTADALKAPASINLLSMRGDWVTKWGGGKAVFNSELQALELPTPLGKNANHVENYGSGLTQNPAWAHVNVGDKLRFAVSSTNNARAQFEVLPPGSLVSIIDSKSLGNGEYFDFVWPAGGWYRMNIDSGMGAPSTVQATLTKLP